MTTIQRKGIDLDPVRPWMWATVPPGNVVEILSYPIPAEGRSEIDDDATIMVRTTVGDPTTLREIPFKMTACFNPDRHEWSDRERRYYDPDNSTAFTFVN